MPYASDRVSRGKRVQEVQESIGDDNNAFADRLNATSRELGLPETWHPVRLSKVRNGTQDLSIEDMTVIARLDPKQRGWTWISFGIAVSKGEDPWAVLARNAKRGKSA